MMGTNAWVEFGGNARESFRAVNLCCLENIAGLADQTEVMVVRDIVDEHGIKIWDKGTALSRLFMDKVQQRRRLLIPLEVCLDVASGVSLASIVDDCSTLMKTSQALEMLGGKCAARGVMRELRNLPVPLPLKLLLTAARERNERRYNSSLARMIICCGLADGLGLNDRDAVLLLLSALVCDIGEMYIGPDYPDERQQLPPEEWKQVAMHPTIGRAFLGEFTNFPPAVAEHVVQHHERQDGSGYPFRKSGADISALGKLVGFADSVSAIVLRAEAAQPCINRAPYSGLGERVELALRIIPDEFPPTAVSLITQALTLLEDARAPAVPGSFAHRILPTLQRLRAARLEAEALLDSMPSQLLASVGGFALNALRRMDKSLHATGVYEFSQVVVLESDAALMGQACLALDEVNWRLRNLARNVYLRIEQDGDAGALAQVADLVAVLNGP